MKTKKTKQQEMKNEVTLLYKNRWIAQVFAICILLGLVIGLILLFWCPAIAVFVSIGSAACLSLLIIMLWGSNYSSSETLLRKQKKIASLQLRLTELEESIPDNKQDYSEEHVESLKKIYKLATKIQRLEVQIEILLLGVKELKD